MSDQVRVKCPGCKTTIKASSKHWGKKVKCPQCTTPFEIPLPEASVVTAEPANPRRAASRPSETTPVRQRSSSTTAKTAQRSARRKPNREAAVADPNVFEIISTPDDDFGSATDFEDYGNDEIYDDYESYDDYEAPPPRRSPPARRASKPKSKPKKKKRSSRSRESGETPPTVIGGIVAMVIAVIWFVAGLAGGVIFFYPPIMFVLGLLSFLSALFNRD